MIYGLNSSIQLISHVLNALGLERDPKWGHLKDVHKALNLCKKALFWGSPVVEKLGPDQEVSIYIRLIEWIQSEIYMITKS